MLTAEQIGVLRDSAEKLLDPITEYLLDDIAKRVAAAGQFTGTASYQVWRLQELGLSQRQIKKEVAKRLKISLKDTEKLLTQVAKTGYNFDMSRFPTKHGIPFAANSSLQQILQATVQLAKEDLTNITQTIGFVGPDGKCRRLTDAYNQACDFAFQKASTGAQDYWSAIREATKNLADQGIRVIDYESGVHTSLEAAVRRNIMGGAGLMQEQISQLNHDELGCDGWEISAHAASAPDHEPYQGKQYTDSEYYSLNNSLVRRIGTLNCGHSAFPIIFGVNDPQYTAEELEQFRKENEEGITIGEKHYTLYEATQRQRKYERKIRKHRHKILVAEGLNDKEQLQTAQIKMVRLQEEYVRFSKDAKLPLQHARMEVSGFNWKHAKAAESYANEYYDSWSKSIGANESAKTLADYYEMKYNRPEEYKLLQQYARDVEAGWITPLCGFDNYKNLHNRIQTEIIGQTAANGTTITGQVPHFMQRVVGTMFDPEKSKSRYEPIRRSGVEIDEIKKALFTPIDIGTVQIRKSGQRSVKLIGEKCAVSVNPDTGTLIQTNPL